MKHVYTSIFTLVLLTISSNSFAQGPNGSGTYYQAADGKKGAELKTALCGIIYNRTERTYKQLWTDFYTTDAKCLTLKNVESKTTFKDGQNRRISFVGITGACPEA